MNLWYRSDYSIVDHDFIYNLQYRSIYDDIVDNEWYIIYINNNIIYNYDTVDYDYFGDYDTHDIDSSFSIDARAIVASVVWVGRVSVWNLSGVVRSRRVGGRSRPGIGFDGWGDLILSRVVASVCVVSCLPLY